LSVGNTANLTVSRNVVNGLIDGDAVDTLTVFADPLFVDTIEFKLQAGSPAINTALKLVAPVNDYYGMIRDMNPDRGAVEYFSNSSLTERVAKKNLTVFPNPTSGKITLMSTPVNKIQVFNSLGVEVTGQTDVEKFDHSVRISLDRLSNGIYFVKMDQETLPVIKNAN